MKLRIKLLLAQLPLAVALAVVGLIAVTTFSQLADHSQTILRDNYRSVLAAQRMKESIERIDSAALFLLAGQSEKGIRQANQYIPQFEAELKVEEGNITEAGEREAAAALRETWAKYQAQFQRYSTAVDSEAMKRDYFAELEPLFLRIKRESEHILSMNQDAMVRKSDRVQEQSARLSALMISTVLGALVLGTLISMRLTSRLLRPLSVLTQAAHRLGEGDLNARALVVGQDEISKLGNEFNAMADRLGQYQRSSLGQLLQAQLASQAAIDSIPDPVVIFGIEGKVLNINRAAETLLSLRFEADSADPLSRVEPPIRAALERARSHVLGGKGPYVPKGFEEAVRTPSAEGERYFLPRAEPVYGQTEGIIGTTVIMQDVTRLRRFDELKNDLVATVAHEFRTPLTSLRMAVHLCLEEVAGPVTPKQAELLQASREDCERLQVIVDDLLDLARIQSGRIEMHPEPLSAEELVDTAFDAFRAAAVDHDLDLGKEVAPLMGNVMADQERIRIVISNLLTNAIRHTPPGGKIRIRARQQGGFARFEVADTGKGIPKEYQRSIFERFFRVPGAKKGGAGLGLSICQEIVRASGGEIGLESEPDQGSTFWFTLPLAPPSVG